MEKEALSAHARAAAINPTAEPFVLAASVLAASLPSLLAYNVSPSPTFLNQALAFGCWAGFVLACAAGVSRWRGSQGSMAPLMAALALLLGATAWGVGGGALPASLALSVFACLSGCAVIVLGGAAAQGMRNPERIFSAFCLGWLVAGAANVAIALLQVFAPDIDHWDLIASSGLPGRAVGNLRQPNHLSSLLLWSCIATIALCELGRLRRAVAAALFALMVFAVVLSASRTGLVSVVLLGLWGLLDRRLSRQTRVLLLTAPLIYALSWGLMAQWAAASQHSFGGTARLAEGDISSSRFAIWRDTLELIRMHPWTGVGLGEFNFAWTLSPFPNRPTAFFDHTHNLPLQLLVELGLPLGGAVIALLLWALWRGLRNAWTADGARGTAQRCAMLMVLMIGLHSLLEYPLWYSYFLLPAAWAWGFALGRRDTEPHGEPALPAGALRGHRIRALPAAAAAVMLGAVLSAADYARVAAIFTAGDNAPPLAERIITGQRSVFFAHHADYAAVTSGVPVPDPARAFDRATHYLLDTRLMIAWATSLAAQGRVDQARYLAQRLREFRKDDAAEFFAPCSATPPLEPPPFQCQAPQQAHSWREFLPHGASR